ncbi:MAG: AMP-binding protein [Actinobacteria bacterium]|nr:AMP-binding protein [Actinomycetota bacterium]
MAVGADPDRVAVTGPDAGTLTVAALERGATALATRITALGLERVAWLGGNDVALPIALFAAARAGVPFLPLNYRLADDRLVETLAEGPTTALVATVDASTRAAVTATCPITFAASELTHAVEVDPDASSGLAPVDDDTIAVQLSTSGTTSRPKAAILRHRHLTSYLLDTVDFGSCDETEAVLVSVPPYHIAGVATILSNLFAGRRIVYLEPFDPIRWLATARTERVTHAMVVPTMLARIVDALDGDRADVPALRSLAYGGAPTPRQVIERALEAFVGVDFVNAYGLTETASTIALLGGGDHRAAFADPDPAVRARLSSVGRPLPGVEIAVVDDDGNTVDPGVVGDVLVRGAQVSGEYLGHDRADGWFATRDRGHLDADGYLFLDGRADDTIIRGAENIAPAEVEDVLVSHPAVRDCAVVGVPDPEWGQRIAAAVVVDDGAIVTAEELRDWVRSRLRGSRTPDVVTFRDELPYTDTGKLLRRVIRDELTAPS